MAIPGGRRSTNLADAPDYEAVVERAARLGITPQRILQEWARIAFANLRPVADWGPGGISLKKAAALAEADAAAIAELVPAAGGQCRVKLHDKKAALEALARILGMFERPAAPRQEGEASEIREDPREVIVRRLARLAAGAAEERGDPGSVSRNSDRISVPVGDLGAV